MALNRSPEFKEVIVQIVCVVKSQFESAWDEEDFNIFLCISTPPTWGGLILDPGTTISTN